MNLLVGLILSFPTVLKIFSKSFSLNNIVKLSSKFSKLPVEHGNVVRTCMADGIADSQGYRFRTN